MNARTKASYQNRAPIPPPGVLVTGNTYPVKDALKALGGRWDAQARGWRVPAEVAEQARALLPPAAPRCGGVHARRGLLRGELWQECRRRGCDNEPVCVICEYCERHRGCGDDRDEERKNEIAKENARHASHAAGGSFSAGDWAAREEQAEWDDELSMRDGTWKKR